MSSLLEKLSVGSGPIALYGIAPPKRATDPERLLQIVQQQQSRFSALGADGIVIYDIQDESARTEEPRPFPFLPTIDPVSYAERDLGSVAVPKIVYRAIPALEAQELTAWLDRIQAEPNEAFAVFVGAPSREASRGRQTLKEAYELARQRAPKLVLGGIAIAERHARKFDEHARIISKTDAGCRFFITQAVYDAASMKSLLSDYALRLQAEGRGPVPIICTFSPCGSEKTLAFMKWLGISFPRWLENELLHSSDALQRSVELCEAICADVLAYAREKQLLLGINVESVSIRKAEVEASVELFRRLKTVLERAGS